jgi:hypothetical protein
MSPSFEASDYSPATPSSCVPTGDSGRTRTRAEPARTERPLAPVFRETPDEKAVMWQVFSVGKTCPGEAFVEFVSEPIELRASAFAGVFLCVEEPDP